VKSKRLALILLAAAVLVAGALAFRYFRPARAGRMNPPVAIEDGKTIDFSSGTPVVKDSTKEKAIIDAAVKEMDAAVRDVAAKPAENKAAVPASK
jgi:hypothetical protein